MSLAFGTVVRRSSVMFVLLCLLVTLAAPPVHAAPGDLDLTFAGFGNGGIEITTGVPMGGGDRGMVVQPDGKIVVAGYTSLGLLVMRYLPNGQLDPTFSGDGIATHLHPQHVVKGTCVAVHTDGTIAVAGWADTGPADFMVARLTAGGAMDPTFSGDGFATTDFEGDTDQAFSVLVQPDGKIVAAGRTLIGGDYDFAVARYNLDGSLDNTFAGDGKGSVGFGDIGPVNNEACYDIALQNDGKLVLVGGITQFAATTGKFKLARLHGNGSPDDSFGGDGEVEIELGPLDTRAAAVAIQADGRIVVAGSDAYDPSDAFVARFLPNGFLDVSFDGNGVLSINALDGGILDVAVQPDGKIMLLGWHDSPLSSSLDFAFLRLDPGGSLDVTFMAGGYGFLNIGSTDIGHDVALLADGRIVAFGSTGSSHALVRLWQDGQLDAGGRQTLGIDDLGPGSDELAYALAVQSDGKIIAAGEVLNPDNTESDAALARFLPDGRLDTGFGVQGHVIFGFGVFNGARAVAIQPDNQLVAAGYFQSGSTINFMVARFNPDGTPDNTFALVGTNIIDFLGGNDYGNALALAPDGKIVVAGTVFNGARFVFGVARFNSDGTPDNSFDTDGKQLYEFAVGPTHWASAVVVQPDLKIVVGGHVGANFALVRFNENGSLDGTFGLSGRTQTDMGGNDYLNALALAPNGWLYAAGVRDLGGNTDFAIAQYKPNGTLASCPPFPCSNWPTGMAFVDWGGSESAYAIDVRSDGQVVVAGCVAGQLGWAQLRPNTPANPIKGLTDFAGNEECALGVKFAGTNSIVAAGFQTMNGDRNMALARFETTPNALVGVGKDEPVVAPPSVRLHEAFPNPLVDHSTIVFDLPRSHAVRLLLHDVAGRQVRTLAEGAFPAGRHQRVWDGTDDRGRPVAAGIYFARLVAGTDQFLRSVVVLR